MVESWQQKVLKAADQLLRLELAVCKEKATEVLQHE